MNTYRNYREEARRRIYDNHQRNVTRILDELSRVRSYIQYIEDYDAREKVRHWEILEKALEKAHKEEDARHEQEMEEWKNQKNW